MTWKQILFAPFLCLAVAAGTGDASRTPEECLRVIKDKVTAVKKVFKGGSWIDDSQALIAGGWEPGMDVMAVKYCETKDDKFGAIQLVVGHDSHVIELQKHGNAGKNPSCRRWDLDEGDYIRYIEYTWDKSSGDVVSLVFQTYQEKTRVVGRGKGSKVLYEYSTFQPFVGFFSYEVDDNIKAFGGIEDDCHNTPTRLPFGMADMNSPSTAELSGKNVAESVTWENETHGEAVLPEDLILDEVERYEKENDQGVDDISENDRVANDNFVDVNVNVIVQPSEKNVPSKPDSEPTMMMQGELDTLRQELVLKDQLLARKGMVNVTAAPMENEEESAAWTLFTIMTIATILLIFLTIFLCCYIKTLKQQQRSAMAARMAEKAAGLESDSENQSPPKKGTAKRQTALVGAQALDKRQTPSTVGLREFQDPYQAAGISDSSSNLQPQVQVYQPTPQNHVETSNTHMLGVQTPIGTYATGTTDKQKNQDDNLIENGGLIVNPQNVQLEFESAPASIQQTGANEVNSEHAAKPPGVNPFQSEQSDADLGLSDRSEQGPTGFDKFDQFNAVAANPSARQ